MNKLEETGIYLIKIIIKFIKTNNISGTILTLEMVQTDASGHNPDLAKC